MFRVCTALILAVSLTPFAFAAEGSPPPDGKEADFKPMFNGKDFEGWKKVGGGATYRIEDGVIIGEVGPGPNTFLRTEKEYDDFILKLDLKLEVPGNSGVQFRSHQRGEDEKDPGRVCGYQMEVDPSDRRWSGGIYDEARRGWIYDLKDKPEAQAAFKLNDWNEYVIKAEGDHIQTWVNGVPVADLHDDTDAKGFIALQVHSGKQGKILWKNVRIKELGGEDADKDSKE